MQECSKKIINVVIALVETFLTFNFQGQYLFAEL